MGVQPAEQRPINIRLQDVLVCKAKRVPESYLDGSMIERRNKIEQASGSTLIDLSIVEVSV